jgi:4-amino-4-deoxy-L-arabinose transferase-like glycosyltransferase
MDSTLLRPTEDSSEPTLATRWGRVEPNRMRSWSWRMSLVLAFAVVLFFTRLGGRALWSEELRWAEIPREMQLRSNYLWPTINGRTYYDKPLGSYWLVLFGSAMSGSVDEWAARFPSALSGVLGVLLMLLLARRLYDKPTAVLAGLILATSFSFVFFSRHASTDVETVTGVLACLWLFHRNQQDPGGWWTLLLWLFMALTSLAKGLLGFVLPILIIGIYSTLTPTCSRGSWFGILARRNRWFFNGKSFLAIPLGLVVYLSPFLLSFAVTGSQEGLQMVYRENIRRFFDPVNHRGPFFLYCYMIFALMAPWSLLLPAGLVHLHQTWRTESDHRDSNRFVLVFFWATFLFFTFSSSRRGYYLLPILPAGSLLIARLLTQQREPLGNMVSLLQKGGYALLAIVSLVGLVLLSLPPWMLPAPWNQLPHLPHVWVLAVAWVIGIGLTVFRFNSRNLARSFAWISCSFMAYLFLIALPFLETFRTQKPFASAVRQRLGSETGAVALFRHRDLVYYLDQLSPLAEFTTKEALAEGIRAGKVRWVILRRADVEAITVPTKVLASETVHAWEAEIDVGRKLILVEVRP